MGYKNVTEFLVGAAGNMAAIEAQLPAGAPKLSERIVEATGRLPTTLPDFIIEIPTLPAPPTIPPIGGLGLGRRRGAMGVREIVTEQPAVAREGRTRFLY